MQRYFINENQKISNLIEIKGKDYHHIKNVMRMKEKEQVIVCIDNLQKSYICNIESIGENTITLTIEKEMFNNTELPVNTYIAQGLVRREKSEEVLKKIVELGAVGYIPVQMSRSIVKIKDKSDSKMERLNTIVKEASEQSHRNQILKVYSIMSIKELISFSDGFQLKLFAYEESGKENDKSFKKLIKCVKPQNDIIVLIGPEGGFTLNEVDLLVTNGFKPIGLGPRILRTETAPLYVMSAISYELELGGKYE